MQRQAGILMPVYSLPGKYGCGTLGREAFKFVDFLAESKQSYWQMLPIGPTGFGDSPYHSYSSFAGNSFFIDLELLIDEGFLSRDDLEALDFGDDPSHVNYEKLYNAKNAALELAWQRARQDQRIVNDVNNFKMQNAKWVSDYTLYMAVKEYFEKQDWPVWPAEDIKLHYNNAIEYYGNLLADRIDYYSFVQFEFDKQWHGLKAYANGKGVKLIGDVPVYVPLDSVDVWAESQFFMLDERHNPTELAGVPPDAFSETGQLWGNPLYNWERMRNDGYGWWIRRIEATLRFFDIVRIDHFRGFESYWAVPGDAKDARAGHWVKGPGMDFVGIITSWFGKERFIAEDLGAMTPDLHKFLDDSGLPGMKVLEFAFDPTGYSNHLPHFYKENLVCYVGTHDNAPAMEWLKTADPKEVEFAKDYCACGDEDFNTGLIRFGMASIARLFIAQMQDWLGLGEGSRTNVPGKPTGNWSWRMEEGALTKELSEKIAKMTKTYGRANG